MSSFPDEILLNIFSRLRVKSLLVCRCVCKTWCILLRDPIYIKILLNRAIEKKDFSLILREGYRLFSIGYNGSFSPKEHYEAVEMDCPIKSSVHAVRVLGSCNGLICLTAGVDETCIWNPSTKEYKKVPTPTNEFPGLGPSICIDTAAMAYGFGYDCNIEDYKLVRVVGFWQYKYCSEVQVYTLGTDSWRHIRSIPYIFSYWRPPGVLVNGALHWVATPCVEKCKKSSDVIVSFDIGDERFQEVPQPERLKDDDKYHSKNVGVVGGCLYLHDNIISFRVEVWVMKVYGVRESWTKLFTLNKERKWFAVALRT